MLLVAVCLFLVFAILLALSWARRNKDTERKRAHQMSRACACACACAARRPPVGPGAASCPLAVDQKMSGPAPPGVPLRPPGCSGLAVLLLHQKTGQISAMCSPPGLGTPTLETTRRPPISMKQMELNSFPSMHPVYHMKKKAFVPTATRYLEWYLFL